MNNLDREIKFHWRLLQGGEPVGVTRARQFELDSVALPDIKAQAEFSLKAEEAGIDSLLTDVSYGKPDPLLLASGIISHTSTMKFLVAIRSGMISPTYFVQQANTFSALYNGKLLFNIVAGHSPDEMAYYGDFLNHDQRYDRTEEFLAVCRAFWSKTGPVNYKGEYYKIVNGKIRTPYVSETSEAPYIFVAGNSDKAKQVAIKQGDCWMRLPDVPEKVRLDGVDVLAAGKEVGLRMAIISRDTKQESIAAAAKLLEDVVVKRGEAKVENSFVKNSDSIMMKNMYDMSSKEWITPYLWTGAVKTFGAPTIALVGDPEEVSDAIIEYKKAGVSQFIFSGWPKLDEMVYFGKNILPLVRSKERAMINLTKSV
jgi:alkanesulfonate monooxygenase